MAAPTGDTKPYLSGKVAIVTGASRGIGRAIALRLGELGATLALAARDAATLRALSQSLGRNSSHHAGDLSLPDAGNALVHAVVGAHGRIDIVVNNAGGGAQGSLTELDDHAWSDAFDLKLFGGMRVARAAWTHLVASQGALINIAGVAGRAIDERNIIAATQCSGYYAMTKSMAALGLKDGVQVNTINPGPVWTDRLRARLPSLGVDASLPEDEILKVVAQKYNVRRVGLPQDIANLVAFVLSPSGGLFHGAVIDFDGGAVRGL